jgi:hypothetical protein
LKKFVLKLCLLVGVNVVGALTVIIAVDSTRSFEQWETDSVLYVTHKNVHYDFVTLGTSRARIFSEFKGNCDYIHDELKMRFLNLAIPFGGGILPEKMFLEYFYARGNSADCVVLLLDPFTLFSDGSNLYHRFVFYEPFRPRFLLELFQNKYPIQRIITYVRSKFGLYWFQRAALVKEQDPRVATRNESDAETAKKRMDSLYPDGLNETAFVHYSKVLEEIFAMAKAHSARMIVITPPTLLGPEPGAARLKEFLDQCGSRYSFEFYDYTNVMQDYSMFADHDHLNSNGFRFFTKNYLEPILRKKHD